MNSYSRPGLKESIAIAFKVLASQEVLLSLLAFILIWLLLRYIANPRSGKKGSAYMMAKLGKDSISRLRNRMKQKDEALGSVDEEAADDDDFQED